MGDAGGESVRVIVRLRPEEDTHSGGRRNVRPGGNTAADGQGLAGSCVLSVEQQKLTIVDPGSHDKNKEVKQAHDFTFDHVFGPAATQSEVFETVKPLVHATVDGFTTTVFAYGSTGSGKTHTIAGTEDEPGILPRAVHMLFQRLQSDAAAGSDKAFMVFLTYVEIYNNVFHNLLEGMGAGVSEGNGKKRREDDDRGRRHGSAGGSGGDKKKSGTSNSPNSQAQPPLPSPQPSQPPSPPTPPPSKIEVREHPSRGVFLSGGEGLRVPVSSAEAVEALVSRGAKARATAATSLNDRSSRSHAILILEIEASQSPPSGAAAAAVSLGTSDVGGGNRRGRVPKAGRRRRSIAECVSIGKMQLVDLAGSERVSMSGVEGSALVEAQNINLSLSLLGDVLSALSKYHRAAARSAGGAPDASTLSTPGLTPSATTIAGSAVGGNGNKPFVPYRNSKLTYLLKDSLGGNCKTLMICAVRAAPACFQQTMMSLRYAGRARDIKNIPHKVLEGSGGSGGHGGPSLRGTVDEIERLRSKLVETTAEFKRLRGATASSEYEKEELRSQLQALADKNRAEKHRMDQLLEGVIHSQKGELERRKEEFGNLQETMDSHAETIEKQKETIRDLQTEREAAAFAATSAREQAEGLTEALLAAERVSAQLHEEMSTLRADGELLRIERDRQASSVRRLEEERQQSKVDAEEMDLYRKAVKKLGKEREGLKAAVSEAESRAGEATGILAAKNTEIQTLAQRLSDAGLHKKQARDRAGKDAVVAAASREEACALREGAANRRALAAENAALEARTTAERFTQALDQKRQEKEDELIARTEAERQRDEARNDAATAGEKARRYRAERDRHAASLEAASRAFEVEKGTADRAKASEANIRGNIEAANAEIMLLKESLGLAQRQKAELELGRELEDSRKREIESTLVDETARRSNAEARVVELDQTAASLSEEVESLRGSLADASSDRAAATDRVRRLSIDRRAAVEQLDQAMEKIGFMENSMIDLREELAAANGLATSMETRLAESSAAHEAKVSEMEAAAARELQEVKEAHRLALIAALSAAAEEATSAEARRRDEEISAMIAERDALHQTHSQERDRHIIDIKSTIELQHVEVAQLKGELKTQELEAAREVHQAREAALESARQELERREAAMELTKVRALEEAEAKAAVEIETAKKEREREAEELRRALELQKEESSHAAKMMARGRESELEEEHRRREKEVEEFRGKKDALRKEAEELRESLEVQKAETEAVTEMWEQRLESKRKEAEHIVSSVTEELRSKEQDVVELKRDLELVESNAALARREVAEQRELKEKEDSTMNKQLRALGRQVHNLEQAKKTWGQQSREASTKSAEAVAAAEAKAIAAEDLAADARRAQEDAVAAATAAASLAEKIAIASREEAELTQTRLSKELECSLAETSTVRAGLKATEARMDEVTNELELLRGEFSTQHDQWRKREGKLEENLRELQAAVSTAKAESTEHESNLASAHSCRRKLEAEQEDARDREAELGTKAVELEATVASLRQELEEVMIERDEVESLGQQRGAGLGQRLVELSAELRTEKAAAAALRAASETAKLDAEDRESDMASLRAKTTVVEQDKLSLEAELPRLQVRLQEKDLQYRRLADSKSDVEKHLEEESARASDLERETEYLRAALRQSVATVQQHITSAAPDSPAALLAADPAFYALASAARGRAGTADGILMNGNGSPVGRAAFAAMSAGAVPSTVKSVPVDATPVTEAFTIEKSDSHPAGGAGGERAIDGGGGGDGIGAENGMTIGTSTNKAVAVIASDRGRGVDE